jgi:hypothetical protein
LEEIFAGLNEHVGGLVHEIRQLVIAKRREEGQIAELGDAYHARRFAVEKRGAASGAGVIDPAQRERERSP